MRSIFWTFVFLSFTHHTCAQELGERDIDPIRTSFYMEQFQKGVKMYAYGERPSWLLELISDKDIRLQLDNGTLILAKIYSEMYDSLLNANMYFAETPEGYIQYNLIPNTCFDSWSQMKHPYQAIVHYHDRSKNIYLQYHGCAEWMPDYRLHDIWMLYQIDEEILDKGKLKGHIPRLELQVDRMTMMGMAGCSEVESSIILNKDMITFKKIDFFKAVDCEYEKMEKDFLRSLEFNTYQYEVGEGQLKLSKDDKIYIFKRTVTSPKKTIQDY